MEDFKERLDAMASLLTCYGNTSNEVTLSELWAGCKDGSIILREAQEYIAELERTIEELSPHWNPPPAV